MFGSVCVFVPTANRLYLYPSVCVHQFVVCFRVCVRQYVFLCLSVSGSRCMPKIVCVWGGETGSGTQEPVSYSHSTLSLSSSLAIALYLSLSLCLSSPVLTAQCNQNPKTCSSYTRAGHG